LSGMDSRKVVSSHVKSCSERKVAKNNPWKPITEDVGLFELRGAAGITSGHGA